MAETVYLLCAATSLLCALFLLRGYRRSAAKLLLWSGVCFIGLFLNNVILFLDIVVFKQLDLSIWRLIPAVVGLAVLCYAMIAEAD